MNNGAWIVTWAFTGEFVKGFATDKELMEWHNNVMAELGNSCTIGYYIITKAFEKI